MAATNPFAAGAPPREPDPNLDTPPSPGPWLILAAAALGISGLFAFTYGAQLLVFVRFGGVADGASFAWTGLGILEVALAALVSQGRSYAAVVATALAAVSVPVSLVWNVYVLLFPLLSPLGMLWFITTVPAAVLTALAIGPAQRLTLYRKKLMEP
jgi:hypothetical protein